MGLAVGVADEVAGLGALGVVRRRLAVELLRGGVGRALAVGRLEVDPGRHPDDGADPVLAHLPDHPRGVGELVGVEAPGVVLRLPGRVDHDRVERQLVVAVAAPVVLDVVLVLVDVAALPVPVGPLGQQGRQAGLAQQRPQPRGRGGVAGRGGGGAGRRRHGPRSRPGPRVRSNSAPGPEVSSHAAQPRRGEQPGDRRVVALGDAPVLEELGRAVGAGVAAVGAELRRSGPRWSKSRPCRAPRPVRRSPARRPSGPRGGAADLPLESTLHGRPGRPRSGPGRRPAPRDGRPRRRLERLRAGRAPRGGSRPRSA